MNAFHGKDLASVAFQKELERLAPSYTPRDLQSDKHSLTSSLMYEISTAHQQYGAFEGEYLEDTQDQPELRSFLDLNMVRNMQHATRELFEMTSNRWRSPYAMTHPPFGYFKFIYSPCGMIDYYSCFNVQEVVNLSMSNVVTYPRPSSSWLNVVPGTSTKAGSESETSENTDNRTRQPDTNSLTENSDATSILSDSSFIAQLDSSMTPMKTVYIPPHKRVDPIAARPRTQSESSVPASKSDISGREKKYPSLEFSLRQKNAKIGLGTRSQFWASVTMV
ncbi:hypothetical protein DSL72_006866 [Monilinia vaccinii-corymbosi]|uniref:Uncharacterized protein n=1 Tax=Monilinia vaccinii-corymbosi TaxID=61207 RepID=A0A8A3PLA1_9HELO|nr:hypothetical protein DSL72_006866 [Monilinia vaccinii-corymbosi]